MLKQIVLKNFVHFKDKTVITFDTSRSYNSTAEAGSNKTPTSSNGLHLFVGANYCGKSTVLELIRRCMTEEINASVTRSFNTNSIAYAFCQFNLFSYGPISSGIIKKPGSDVVYKVFIHTNNDGTLLRLRSSDSSITYNDLVKATSDTHKINLLIKNPTDRSVRQLLCIIKERNQTINFPSQNKVVHCVTCFFDAIKLRIFKEKKLLVPDEPSWKNIEEKYIATFPLRGIGSVQWTRSERIRKKHKVYNYHMACERAEVVSTLLSERNKILINEEEEKGNFRFITHPEIFEFKEKEGRIVVQHERIEFPLLKLSEGILEAKLTCLLLAHKDIETLCLEDPDRGMHPQMIERLKTVLYKAASNKTIIVVTHSPYFIDTTTLDKTHVFFRKKTVTNSYACSVKNAGKNKELSKVSDNETLRTLLFATKVLLVEGPTDREVVQGIFTQYKYNMLEMRVNELNEIHNDITTYQIIPVGGCENTKKVQSFCKFINLPCLCLWDLDKVVKFDKATGQIVEISKDCKKMLSKKYCEEGKKLPKLTSLVNSNDFEIISKTLETERDTFIWKHGAIEDAIIESAKNAKPFIFSALTPKELKKKMKGRLKHKERKTFYAQLMELRKYKDLSNL